MASLKPEERRELSTAYHEAGHAVVSFYLFMPFKYVTVTSDKTDASLGHVAWSRPPKWATDEYSSRPLQQREFWENHVMIGFAGRVAQQIFLGKRVQYGHGSDYQNIAEHSLRFGGSSPDVHVHWCRWLHARTKTMVETRWKDIEAVARALVIHKRLTHDQVTNIINELYTAPRR